MAESLKKQRRKMLGLFLNFLSFFLGVVWQNLAKGGGRTNLAERLWREGESVCNFIFPFSFGYLISKANIAINAYHFLSCGLAKTMCNLSGFLGVVAL